MASPTKRWLTLIGRIAVTALLLWWIVRSLDIGRLAQLFRQVELLWIAAACATILVARFLIALRWRILLDVHGMRVGLWALNKVVFISMFVGQFLPGVVGTDVIRGYTLAKSHGRGGVVVMSLVVDRVAGVFGMILLAVTGASIAEAAGRPTGLLPTLIGLLAALALASVTLPFVLRRIVSRPRFRATRFEGLWNKITAIITTATELARHPRAAAATLAVSIAIVTVRCFVFFELYRAFGTAVPVDALMVFIPVMFVAVLIPISLGGLGVREAVLVYFFGTIGVPAEVSVSVGIMFQFLQIVTSSPGLVFWWTDRHSARGVPAATASEVQADDPTATRGAGS